MTISVLVPAWNASDTLAECLQSITGADAEIIVVDDSIMPLLVYFLQNLLRSDTYIVQIGQ